MFKILPLLILLLFFINSCSKNKSSIAVSHCADIKYINFANNNPELFINSLNLIDASIKTQKKIDKWKSENDFQNSLMGGMEFKKITEKLSLNAISEYLLLNSKVSDVLELNKKTVDYKIEYKKTTYLNYDKYFSECFDEALSNSDLFIDRYYEWKPQNVSNILNVARSENEQVMKFINQFDFAVHIRELYKTNMILLN